MMMYEFVERTGFQPTADEYEQIVDAYYNFDGDKDAFCKAFVEQGGELKIYKARADEIDRLRSQMLEIEKQFKKDVADRDRRIDQLTAELDRALEWKPSTGTGTNMDQGRYKENEFKHIANLVSDKADFAKKQRDRLIRWEAKAANAFERTFEQHGAAGDGTIYQDGRICKYSIPGPEGLRVRMEFQFVFKTERER